MKAIHCKTKEEFKKVLKIFEEKGWRWFSGDNPTNFIPYTNENDCVTYKNNMEYGSINHFKYFNVQVISFKEFLRLEGRAKSFPRVMLVSDDEDAPLSQWEEVEVLGFAEGADFPWIVTGDGFGEYFGYRHAKEIDAKEREAIKLLESKGYKVTK